MADIEDEPYYGLTIAEIRHGWRDQHRNIAANPDAQSAIVEALLSEITRLRSELRQAAGGRDAVIEECAKAAEALDRIGYEWVRDSLWDRIALETAARIRTLKSSPPQGEESSAALPKESRP